MAHRIFVTGGSGFIGSYLIDYLVSIGVTVGTFCSVRNNFLSSTKIQVFDATLSEKNKMRKAFEEFQPTALVHLAAISSPVYADVLKIYQTNVIGTENLFEALVESGNSQIKVILTSTAGIYGNNEIEFISESEPFNPLNHYSYSKMVMEFLSRTWEDQFDIKIVRPFNIIGSRQNDQFLIPKLTKAFVRKDPIIYVGNLDTIRDYSPVDRTVALLTELLFQPVEFKLLNICSSIPISGHEVIKILEELTGFRPKINVLPELIRRNEIYRSVGDSSKANEVLGKVLCKQDLINNISDMITDYSNCSEK